MRKQATLKSEPTFGEQVTQRLREAGFIVSLALSVFFLLALLTFNRADPSWSHLGMTNYVTNAGGRVGAYLADLFLYIFGYCAYLLPFLLSYSAWVSLRDRDTSFNLYFFTLRMAGYFILFAAACALCTLEFSQTHAGLPFAAGGVLGDVIATHLVNAFNVVGTTLILVALLLMGITVSIGVSWLDVAERLGVIALHAVYYVVDKVRHIEITLPRLPERTEKPIVKEKPSIVRQNNNAKKPPHLREKPVIAEKATAVKTSRRYEKERQAPLFDNPVSGSIPPLTLLDPADPPSSKGYTNAQLEEMSRQVEQRLLDFGAQVQVVAVHPGPVITRFELELAPGLKVSKISGLAKDLARALSVTRVRVVDVIPGKTVVGLELPNAHREMVRLSEILSSTQYDQARPMLSLGLGKDIAGHPVIVDLAKMPHLLVAGTTGSGKSVGLNAMLLSILYKATPADVRMILIDPKMLELSVYDGIPHLLAPVVTDMKEAASALRWCVGEMERRYRLMAALGVRNLAGFNTKIKEAEKIKMPIQDPLWKGDPNTEEHPLLTHLPMIVVVIDELADMMMVVGKKVEQLIARIAQKARAAGIHLILATQRPSVDVLTGLIKSNIPTRMAFQVSSKIDSRTILDQAGAEQLLGHGDMLYLAPGGGTPVRVHSAFVDDHEVHKVTEDWKRRGEPVFIEEILSSSVDGDGSDQLMPGEAGETDEESDPLYDQAVYFITKNRRASISSVQRRFKIGYNRAARLIEEMERQGVVSSMEGNGSREVLAPPPPEDA